MAISPMSDYPRWLVEMRQLEACDPLIGQPIRARLCYDRRYAYAGVIEGRSDGRFWIDDEEFTLYRLRVENKPTFAGYVLVWQENGDWHVFAYPPEWDDE